MFDIPTFVLFLLVSPLILMVWLILIVLIFLCWKELTDLNLFRKEPPRAQK